MRLLRVVKEARIDGQKLRMLREAKGLTQGQLALKAGVAQPQISRFEKGDRINAQLATLSRLADALGVELNDLLAASYNPDELPSFSIYVSRKFRNNPRLQRALVAAYEALQGMSEQEEERIRKARENNKPGE